MTTPGGSHPITLLCTDWTNPLNVGSAFRLADAAGLREIVLAGTTPTPPNRKIGRTARSTVRSVPWRTVEDPVTYLTEAKERGSIIIALEITDTSVSLFDYQLPDTEYEYVLVAGAEAGGVSPALLACCDVAVHLPMYGQNTSMNLAVALGAAVYLLLMQFE